MNLPLSPAQSRMWFLHRLDPESAAYNMPFAFSLKAGDEELRGLEEAIWDLVRRHHPLRTVYPSDDAHPVQRVVPSSEIAAPLLERKHAEPGTLDSVLSELITRPFDISAEIPFRVYLVSGDGHDPILVVNVHHIACDGFSLPTLLDDLGTYWEARRDGRDADIEPLPIHYADFALWNRELLGTIDDPSQERIELRKFWSHALNGSNPAPEPPHAVFGNESSGGTNDEVASAEFRLPVTDYTLVENIAQAHGTTPFAVLFALFAGFLSRHGAGDDVAVAVPVSGRTEPQLLGLVGLFVNTIVLRLRVGPTSTLHELLTESAGVVADGIAHQELPFEDIVANSEATWRPNGDPLTYFLSFESTDLGDLRIGGVKASVREIDFDTGRVPVSLVLSEDRAQNTGQHKLSGKFEFRGDIRTVDGAQEFSARFAEFCMAWLAAPECTLARIPTLSRHDLQRITAFSENVVPLSRGSFPQLLHEMTVRRPNAVAIEDGDTELTYTQLEEWSREIAAALRESGVGRGDHVLVYAHRCAETVAIFLALGILGAVFVPIDPAYPEDRKQFMREDIGTKFALTTGAGDVPPAPTRSSPRADEPASTDAELTDPAYIIFTSGTTGRPKGVVVSHVGLASLAAAHPLRPGDRLIQFCSPSFDGSIAEICMSLLNGATLVIPTGDELSGTGLSTFLADRRISHACIPPAILSTIIDQLDEYPSHLHVVGDACPKTLIEKAIVGRQVFNVYGPSEITVTATHSRSAVAGELLPIGRPVANTSIYILDDFLDVVPPGVAGEIYVGGDGVALGYHDRPSSTATNFIADPFSGPGTRLYRTGDHGRWTDDGEIDFIGRLDDQVKIRGFRIELAEVTDLLRRCTTVSDAVAVASEGPKGKYLSAYVVASGDGSESELVAGIRDELASFAPRQLVPTVFVLMPELPINQNGKVDKSLLPAPKMMPSGRDPRNEQERKMCEMFAQTLGIDAMSPDEDFFDMGGHSLAAAQLAATLSETFGRTVPVRALFENRTAELMMEFLAQAGSDIDDSSSVLVMRESKDEQGPVICLHPALGSARFYEAVLTGITDRTVVAIQSPLLDGRDVEDSMAALSRRYLDVLGDFLHPGTTFLGWSFGGELAHEMACESRNRGSDNVRLVMIDSYPFTENEEVFTDPSDDRVTELVSAQLRHQLGDAAISASQQSGRLARSLVVSSRARSSHKYSQFDGHAMIIQSSHTAVDRPAHRVWSPYLSGPTEITLEDASHPEFERADVLEPLSSSIGRFLAHTDAASTPNRRGEVQRSRT